VAHPAGRNDFYKYVTLVGSLYHINPETVQGLPDNTQGAGRIREEHWPHNSSPAQPCNNANLPSL